LQANPSTGIKQAFQVTLPTKKDGAKVKELLKTDASAARLKHSAVLQRSNDIEVLHLGLRIPALLA
jgi:hypothetical protein